MKFRAVIIEDEKLARNRLKLLLDHYSDTIEVVGEAENGFLGIELIAKQKPELIFLDIQMPGMTGFEMLIKLENIPLVIFTTAYDEFALKAFETNAIDYLLKPITLERLDHAISKLKLMTGQKYETKMMEFLDTLKPSGGSYIKVKTGAVTRLIQYTDVFYFCAEEKYTCLFTENQKYYINDTLTGLEKILPDNFKRIHRSAIINIEHVKEILQLSTNKSMVIMQNNSELPISRRMKKFL